MNKQNSKDNRALLGLILVGAAMALLVAFIVFSIFGIFHNRTDLAAEKALLADTQTRVEELLRLKDKEKENKKLIASYQELLPETYNQDVLLDRIGKTADEFQAEVASVTFSPAEDIGGVNRVPFSLTATGSYQNLMQFMESVAMDGELVVIDQIAWTTGSEAKTTVTATCSVYFQ